MKTQRTKKNQKMSFFKSTNFQFSVFEQFLQFKACKSGEIDAIGIEVTQQIKLSGSPTKGHFSVKNTFLPLLLNFPLKTMKDQGFWPIFDHELRSSLSMSFFQLTGFHQILILDNTFIFI